MPRPEPWVLALAASFSAILFVVFVFQAMGVMRAWRTRRDALESLKGDERRRSDPQALASVVRERAGDDDDFLRFAAHRIPQLWDLHHLLSQSGLDWTLAGFMLRTAFAGLLGAVVGSFTAGAATAAALFALGSSAPYFYVRSKKNRRLLAMEAQLPEAIDLIARAVRAGHPLSEGLRMASEEGPEPLATEFRVTFEEQKFGLPFEEALLGLGDRVEVVDVRILITAILVQREVGGNLSEILEQIAETMRQRFSLKRQVRVYTAQGRMSGYTLAALPIFVGAVISLINPDYMQTLFRDPLGQAMLVAAGFLQMIGFLWIRRIVDVRY